MNQQTCWVVSSLCLCLARSTLSGSFSPLVFCNTFSSLDNSKFLGHLGTCFRDMRWSDAIQLMLNSLKVGLAKVIKTDQKLVTRWKEVRGKIKTGQERVKRTDLVKVFAFIEGTLTEVVKNGD